MYFILFSNNIITFQQLYLQLFPLFTLCYNFLLAFFVGGGKEDRTPDPLLAKQVLSQLSYTPNNWWVWEDLNFRPHAYQACALTT